MFKTAIISAIMLFSTGLWAHEGHKTPGILKANHGGVVKAGKIINLEYVIKGDLVELYPATHEGDDLKLADVVLSGTAKPAKGKPSPLKIEEKNGAFVTKVDFGNTYRVEVQISAKTKEKESKFTIQVEK